jgi:hypothetical protein
MKAQSNRKKRTLILVAAFVVGALLIGGCQSSNKVVSVQASDACPTCKLDTRVQPITGLTYTKGTCPSCKEVSTLDDSTRAVVEDYVGGQVGDTVHVCDGCKTLVEGCSVCRDRSG